MTGPPGRWDRYHPNRLFYGWYIALAGAASNFLLFGIAVVGMGVFFEPMRKELGWSAAALAVGQSIKSAEQGLLSPLSGYLVDRLGPRKLAFVGVVVMSGGLALMSTVHSLWLFYLSAVIMALGQSLGGYTAFSLALVRWFSRKRGRALGLMNAGNGAGFFAAPIIAALVTSVGWRDTLLILSVVYLVVGLSLASVLRPRPEPYGLLPDGVEPLPDESGLTPSAARLRSGSAEPGSTVGEALRTPAFYLMVVSHASGAAVMNAFVVFQIPHLENAGFSLGTIGLFLTTYGGLQITFRLGVGWLGDVIGRRQIYTAGFLMLGLGWVMFANVTPDRLWLLGLYGVVFGFGHACFVLGSSVLAADYFGTKRFGTIRGLAQTMQMPAGVLAPFLVGRSFDVSGDYRTAFLVLGALAATGAIWISLIRRPMLPMPAARG